MSEIRSADLLTAVEVVTAALAETDLENPEFLATTLDQYMGVAEAFPLVKGLMALSILLLARLQRETGATMESTLRDLALKYGDH